MSYVPMTEADLASVVAVENAIQAFPWTLGHFRDSLRGGHECWLQREAGDLIAFSVTMPAVDEVHLLDIGVAKQHQRAGVGARLLGYLCERARHQQMVRMLLEVRPSNSAAIAFYRRFDFLEIGRRRNYYPAMQGREDAIVMAKAL